MIVTFKKPLIFLLAANLCACSFIGKTEINILKQAASQAAQNAPKHLKLDYIKCYALDNFNKEKCRRILSKYSENRKHAESWAYIEPFEDTMELEGFSAFLKDKGKICNSVIEKPKLSHKTKTYLVSCKGKNTYKMEFSRENLTWRLVE